MAWEPAIMDRDVQVILDLHKYRYLSTSQIERLHFPSRQTANRRLRALTQEGYIKGYRGPAADDRVFYLTAKGTEVVAGARGEDEEEVVSERIKSPARDVYFLRHLLQLNDARIAVEKAAENHPAIRLLGFIPEYLGVKTKRGGVTKYLRDSVEDVNRRDETLHYTPDAVFALEKEGKHGLFFLEIDRGTEVLTNPDKGFLKAIRFYYSYFISDAYQRYAEDFGCGAFKGFRVLFVVPSVERIGNMRRAASQLQMKERRFIWLTNADRIRPEAVLAEIWQSAEEKDVGVYGIG